MQFDKKFMISGRHYCPSELEKDIANQDKVFVKTFSEAGITIYDVVDIADATGEMLSLDQLYELYGPNMMEYYNGMTKDNMDRPQIKFQWDYDFEDRVRKLHLKVIDWTAVFNYLQQQLSDPANKCVTLPKMTGYSFENSFLSVKHALKAFDILMKSDITFVKVPNVVKGGTVNATAVIKLKRAIVDKWQHKFHTKYQFTSVRIGATSTTDTINNAVVCAKDCGFKLKDVFDPSMIDTMFNNTIPAPQKKQLISDIKKWWDGCKEIQTVLI